MIGSLLDMFGVNVTTWLLMFVIAWYLFRGARAGKRAGSVLGRVVTYSVLILVSFGAASMLGYANLDIGRFVTDAFNAGLWVVRNAVPAVREFLSGVIG